MDDQARVAQAVAEMEAISLPRKFVLVVLEDLLKAYGEWAFIEADNFHLLADMCFTRLEEDSKMVERGGTLLSSPPPKKSPPSKKSPDIIPRKIPTRAARLAMETQKTAKYKSTKELGFNQVCVENKAVTSPAKKMKLEPSLAKTPKVQGSNQSHINVVELPDNEPEEVHNSFEEALRRRPNSTRVDPYLDAKPELPPRASGYPNENEKAGDKLLGQLLRACASGALENFQELDIAGGSLLIKGANPENPSQALVVVDKISRGAGFEGVILDNNCGSGDQVGTDCPHALSLLSVAYCDSD